VGEPRAGLSAQVFFFESSLFLGRRWWVSSPSGSSNCSSEMHRRLTGYFVPQAPRVPVGMFGLFYALLLGAIVGLSPFSLGKDAVTQIALGVSFLPLFRLEFVFG